MNKFFKNRPIIGMIHTGGSDYVGVALKEMEIYEKEGLDAAIIENYYTRDPKAVWEALKAIRSENMKIKIGVNILPNNFGLAFDYAREFNADFIQIDYVAGRYIEGDFNKHNYAYQRRNNPGQLVLGGVWPKYYHPLSNSSLEDDLRDGMGRADAIVVTGEATGQETPLEKILKFRKIIGDFPLIIGAGVNLHNLQSQFRYCNGIIIGTYFKNSENLVDKGKVREFMQEVGRLRKDYELN